MAKIKQKTHLPRTVQDSIPYKYIYSNSTIETVEGHFSQMWEIDDVNFTIAPDDEQRRIFKTYEKLLNLFPTESNFQIIIHNHKADKRETLRNIHFQSRHDGLNKYRSEMNSILLDKIATGRNSLKQSKYIVASVKSHSMLQAMDTLEAINKDISGITKLISKNMNSRMLSIEERLEVLHNIYNQDGESIFGNETRWDELRQENRRYFSLDTMIKQGLTSKDAIAPSGMLFKDNYFMLGNTYGRTLFLENIPVTTTFLSTDFIKYLSAINAEMIISIQHKPMETKKAIRMIKNQLTNIKGEIGQQQKSALQNGYSPELAVSSDLEGSKLATEDLLYDVTNRDQKLFNITLIVTVFAPTMNEINSICKQIDQISNNYKCPIKTLFGQQEDGLNSCLPLAMNSISVNRIMTSETASLFLPFTSQELFQRNGIFYGSNQTTKNIIVYDRITGNNYNGLIIGEPGSGKSFAAKCEMISSLLRNDKNKVYVIDPQAEYSDMAESLLGEVITLSVGSKSFVNPLDMDIEFGDDPVSEKANYVIGMIEIMLGSHRELDATAKSVVDRCVRNIYKGYMNHINERRSRGENVTFDRSASPTLANLYNELRNQPEPEAATVAGILEIYAVGSNAIFSHRSNIKTDKNFVTYNIKNLGGGMKALGLHICLNEIWNKVLDNYRHGYWTWIYIDEFWFLLQTDSSAGFLEHIWRTSRKWNGIPTGITQNTEDFLTHKSIINNTSFVMMLSESKNDRDNINELFQIPDTQLEFVTNSQPGTGLIYTGNTILPFDNKYPEDSLIYNIASTSKTKDAEQRRMF